MLEFKRILKSKAMFIIWFVFIAVFFSINFMFISKAQNSIRSEMGEVIKYNSFEELQLIIENHESKIEQDIFYTEAEKTNTIKSLSMYKYLYENKIEYNQFRTYNELGIFENDKFGYTRFVINAFMVGFLSLIMFLCVDIYNRDFLNGTYKYVYTRNISRETIVLKKTIINLLIVSSLLLLSFLMIKIIVSRFSLNYDYIILKETETICINAKSAINKMFIFFVLDIIFYLIIFSSLSLFSKNYILNIIIGLVIAFFGSIIIYYIEFKPLCLFMLNGTSLMFDGFESCKIIGGYVIRYVFAIIIFMSSIFVFKKKNL